jgi:hypothetical protein
MSGSSAPTTGGPAPSRLRSVTLYPGGARSNMGLLGPDAMPIWPAKPPADIDWWWIDATSWCLDMGDTLGPCLMPSDLSVAGDGNLVILRAATSVDGFWLGMRLIGGTSGLTYLVTALLRGARGTAVKAVDLQLPCLGETPTQASSPWLADFSQPESAASYYYL